MVSTPDVPSGLTGIAEAFSRQDAALIRNREHANEAFGLIERGVVLGSEMTIWLNDGPPGAARRAKPTPGAAPEQIRANLLHAAWATLVNATRLTLFGAHVDALTLARGAFEAVYHAEFFRDHPAAALEWDQAGLQRDVYAVRNHLRNFEHKYRVRATIGAKYSPDTSHDRLFVELSTYGAHANPKTVGLRLFSQVPGIGSLGFVSVGKAEATLLCASFVLHVLAYGLSELQEGFAADLRPDLIEEHDRFRRDVAEFQSGLPPSLSLIR